MTFVVTRIRKIYDFSFFCHCCRAKRRGNPEMERYTGLPRRPFGLFVMMMVKRLPHQERQWQMGLCGNELYTSRTCWNAWNVEFEKWTSAQRHGRWCLRQRPRLSTAEGADLGSDGWKPAKCSGGAFWASLRAAVLRRHAQHGTVTVREVQNRGNPTSCAQKIIIYKRFLILLLCLFFPKGILRGQSVRSLLFFGKLAV